MSENPAPAIITVTSPQGPPQSAIQRRLLDPESQEGLLKLAEHHEAFWQGRGDGRRLVETVLRECGYALPAGTPDAPLWQWSVMLWRVGWTYLPRWMAKPVVGNLVLYTDAPDGGPCFVGVTLKVPALDGEALHVLRADRVHRSISLSEVHGYLIPPDGCRGCAQRGAVLRQE